MKAPLTHTLHTPCVWPTDTGYCYADRPRSWVIARNAEELAQLSGAVSKHLADEPSVAVGLLRYDAGAKLPPRSKPERAFTDGLSADAAPAESLLAVVAIFSRNDVRHLNGGYIATLGEIQQPFSLAPFAAEHDKEHYLFALERIRQYLLAGDCYQVNFARRFSSRFKGAPLRAWQSLIKQHPSPHGGLFTLPNGDAVFGVSPERFLSIKDRHVVTEPIKGSRARGRTAAEDAQLADELVTSEKDRAENLMIVDLLRNDLGRICIPGSVETPSLFELRQFSNVQHLVSTVTGTLCEHTSPLTALLSCFPGGSITGAPKKRAMEIIAELEGAPRDFYCGTQFSLSSDGTLDSNILIRTFQTQGEQIFCHGGGGIVMDSDPEQEYQESLFKIEALMQTLEELP